MMIIIDWDHRFDRNYYPSIRYILDRYLIFQTFKMNIISKNNDSSFVRIYDKKVNRRGNKELEIRYIVQALRFVVLRQLSCAWIDGQVCSL